MDQKIYHRITEVLSPFTGIEFIPEDILKPAADRGTQVHKHIEVILRGEWEVCVKPQKIYPYLDSFKTFWEKSKHTYESGKITLEKRFYCDKHMISGKPDVLIETDSRTYVVDWKTSSRPQKSWALQGAAYRYLIEQAGYKNVDSVLFVKLSKEGKSPSLHKSEEHRENLDIFFKCLEIYKWFDMANTRNKWRTN